LTFRPDIEGLRAVAILLAVAFHTGFRAFRGGFVGVDGFFVLSGYLITRLLTNEISAAGKIDLKHFYAHRALRLLPALTVMMLTVALVASITLPPVEQAPISETAIAAAGYVSDFFFIDRPVMLAISSPPILCCTPGRSRWRNSSIWFGQSSLRLRVGGGVTPQALGHLRGDCGHFPDSI
jgi:peptidoglycan/LPS O-acetylase OafA/YrhL